MRTTAVINQKGGVGKTATAVGVAGALAHRGKRVLLVDMDPQGHLTVSALQLARAPMDRSLAAVLAADPTADGLGVADLVVTHSREDGGGVLDVLPTSMRMWTLARDLDKRPDRERQLARLLEEAEDRYDHVVLDAPPSLDILADNVLAAADQLVFPVQPDDTSIEALKLLFAQIAALEKALRKPPADRLGLVLSTYRRPLSTIQRSVLTQFESIRGLPILGFLPLATVIPRAWRSGETIARYAPASPSAESYRGIADVVDGQVPPAPAVEPDHTELADQPDQDEHTTAGGHR